MGGETTSTPRIPRAEITGRYGAMVKKFSKKMFGDVPEPVEVAWHNKPVLKFTFGIGRQTRKWHECDENLKSFAHLAVASLIGCTWCLDFGYFTAHNEGLDEAKAREARRPSPAGPRREGAGRPARGRVAQRRSGAPAPRRCGSTSTASSTPRSAWPSRTAGSPAST
jgi:hypothetical protein